MNIWKLEPGKEPVMIECKGDPVMEARKIIGDSLDFTKVVFKGKRCTMAVDDMGLCNGLPQNYEATAAYLKHCYPGTDAIIAGTTVVFDGYLP